MTREAEQEIRSPLVGDAAQELPFVARAGELDELLECLTSSRCGVVVSGPKGTGRTRLAAEFAARVRASGTKVVEIAATAAARHVEFASFAAALHSPGAASMSDDATPQTLGDGFERLCRTYGPERFVVVIDDLQHLDDTSLLLVHQLMTARAAFILMTAPAVGPLPDTIESLWRAGLVTQNDLAPFDLVETGLFCTAALGQVVDAPTRRRLGVMSGGNLVYLRELIAAGRATGVLAKRGDVWSWHGPITPGPRLSRLVDAYLGGCEDPTRPVLELLAVAATVELDVLIELVDADLIDDSERRGFVRVTSESGPLAAYLAQPMYGLVLTSGLSEIAMRRTSAMLADALAASGRDRPGDALRIARLEIAAGRSGGPTRMLQAASEARSLGDLETCERLCRAALAAGADAEAAIELDECLIWQGRFSEVSVCDPPERLAELSPTLMARRARADASTALLGGGDAAAALDVLARAEHLLGDHPLVADVQSHRAEIAMFSARFETAITVARAVLADESALAVARATAYGALVPSLALTGRCDEADAVAAVGLDFVLSQPEPPLWEGAGVMVGQFLAALLAGRLSNVEPIVEELYSEAAARPLDAMRGVWALMLGRSAVARGDLDRALALLSESAALLRANDPGRVLPWCLGTLAQAAGQAGKTRLALAAVHELDAERIEAMRAFDTDIGIGCAWALEADGRTDDARRTALECVASALESGAFGAAAWASHEAVRLGVESDMVRSPMSAGGSDGDLAAITKDLRDVIARRDASELVVRAERLAACGAHLWAAELAALAVVYADDGGSIAARALLTRSRELAACPGARTPMLTRALQESVRANLSTRELEVSRLAARGFANPAIAEQCFISRRTVENHLASIYRKLGVSTRAELAELMSTT